MEDKKTMHDILPLCCCGCPDEVDKVLEKILIQQRRLFSLTDGETWEKWESDSDQIIKDNAGIVRELILKLLEIQDITEHGGSAGGSWLTESGERWLMLRESGEWTDPDITGERES